MTTDDIAKQLGCRPSLVQKLDSVLKPHQGRYPNNALTSLADWDQIPWPLPSVGYEEYATLLRWRNRVRPYDPRPLPTKQDWLACRSRHRTAHLVGQLTEEGKALIAKTLAEAYDCLDGDTRERSWVACEILTSAILKSRDEGMFMKKG